MSASIPEGTPVLSIRRAVHAERVSRCAAAAADDNDDMMMMMMMIMIITMIM